MKNNQAFLIALAIIIGAGDRLIAAIESGKSPLVTSITGLVGAAIAVKFLMEQRPSSGSGNSPEPLPLSVPTLVVEGIKAEAEQRIGEEIAKHVAGAMGKHKPPNS